MHDEYKTSTKAEKRKLKRREKETATDANLPQPADEAKKRDDRDSPAADDVQLKGAAASEVTAEFQASDEAPIPPTPLEELQALIQQIHDGSREVARPLDILAADDDEEDDLVVEMTAETRTSENGRASRDSTEGKEEDSTAPPSEAIRSEAVGDSKEDGETAADYEASDFMDIGETLWDVEITDEVRRWFKKKAKKNRHLCAQVFDRLRILAHGERNIKVAKQLHTDQYFTLYEAKLSKSQRILWEEATSFSSRRSSDAGAVYAEVIRVWSIVEDHDYLDRAIEQVKISHKRGGQCHLKRRLHTPNESSAEESDGTALKPKHPRLFLPDDVTSVSAPPKEGKLRQHYPPATTDMSQFTILKFFDLSSQFISATLSVDVDATFPFKVTDQEFKILRMPLTSSILLLGRSGTGKTTCLVYRMWGLYETYWRNALKDNTPSLPSLRADSEFVHLHQLFVTRSSVLRSEVEKNFVRLREQLRPSFEAQDGAFKFSEHLGSQGLSTLGSVPDNRFPIFLGEREFLLLVDASLHGNSSWHPEIRPRRQTIQSRVTYFRFRCTLRMMKTMKPIL